MESNEIVFFGKVDRNRDGDISSEYPAWMLNQQIEDMTETSDRLERAIEGGSIPPSELPYAKEEYKKVKSRLNEIETSKPKITDSQKDELYKEYKRLSSEISDAMFTRSEMQSGLSNAHEEFRRMRKPSIQANSAIALACNITPKNGKISRDEAAKMYKIIGGYLGEQTNTEYLRKERRTK